MTGKQLAALIALIVVLPLIVGAVYFTINTATSDVRGQGESIQIQNEAQNRMQSEKEFNELFLKVQERDRAIDAGTAEMADAIGREEQDLDFYRENLRGAVNACSSAATQYDALVGNPQKAKWRPAALPERIDRSDPAFDCKVSDALKKSIEDAQDKQQTGAGEPSPVPSN